MIIIRLLLSNIAVLLFFEGAAWGLVEKKEQYEWNFQYYSIIENNIDRILNRTVPYQNDDLPNASKYYINHDRYLPQVPTFQPPKLFQKCFSTLFFLSYRSHISCDNTKKFYTIVNADDIWPFYLEKKVKWKDIQLFYSFVSLFFDIDNHGSLISSPSGVLISFSINKDYCFVIQDWKLICPAIMRPDKLEVAAKDYVEVRDGTTYFLFNQIPTSAYIWEGTTMDKAKFNYYIWGLGITNNYLKNRSINNADLLHFLTSKNISFCKSPFVIDK